MQDSDAHPAAENGRGLLFANVVPVADAVVGQKQPWSEKVTPPRNKTRSQSRATPNLPQPEHVGPALALFAEPIFLANFNALFCFWNLTFSLTRLGRLFLNLPDLPPFLDLRLEGGPDSG